MSSTHPLRVMTRFVRKVPIPVDNFLMRQIGSPLFGGAASVLYRVE